MSLSIADASIAEGNTGTTTLNFAVTANRLFCAVVGRLRDRGRHSDRGSDYVATSGTLNFAAGRLADDFVTINATRFRAQRDLLRELSNPLGSTISSGFVIYQPPGDISTNAFATNTTINLSAVRLVRGTLAYGSFQEVRGGLTVPVTVTSSDTNVGVITVSPVDVSATQNNSDSDFDATTAFDPLAGGTTTVTLVQPTGFETISNPSNNRRVQLTATVDASSFRLCSMDGAVCSYGSTGTLRVGEDLQTVGYFQLEGTPPAPVDVTVTVANEAVALVSASETGQGQKTIVFAGISGANQFRYFALQGLVQGQATTVTISAPGFAPLTYTVETDPSGFVIYQPPGDISTNAFATNTTINLSAVRLVRGTLAYGSFQEVRGGLTVPVTVTSSDTNVGVITVSPVDVSATQNNSDSDFDATTAFDPLAGGTTTVTLVQPTGFETISNPSNNRRVQLTATVDASSFRLCSMDGAVCSYGSTGTLRVGEDLQTVGYFQLEGTPPAPVDVTVTVANEAVALVSASETGQGQKTIVFAGISGANQFRYFALQGLVQGQATTVTISAPGFAPLTYTVETDPSGFVIYQPPGDISTNAFATNTTINLSAVRLVRGTLAYGSFQEVRGGLTVPVTVTSSDTNVGVITVSPVDVSATQNNNDSDFDATTAFDPLAGGTTTVTLVQPAGYETISNPSNNRRVQLTATVDAPRFRLCSMDGAVCSFGSTGTLRVGEDLQTVGYFQLEGDPPNPVAVTVSTGSAAVAVVSDSETAAGQQSMLWRLGSESNRRTRLCRPLHDHSAT